MSTFFTIIFHCTGCGTEMTSDFHGDEIWNFDRWHRHRTETSYCEECWDKVWEEVGLCMKHLELDESPEHPYGYFGSCMLGRNHDGDCQPHPYGLPYTPEEEEECRRNGELFLEYARSILLPEEQERFDKRFG